MDALAAARRLYRGRDVRPAGAGQLSLAVIVDDELLVRFPRHPFGMEQMDFEVRLLDRIRTVIPVAVPEVIEVALDRPIGEAHVAHRLLPGEVVTPAVVAHWAEPRLLAVAEQVAVFLRHLHHLTVEGGAAGTPRLSPHEFAAHLAREFATWLAPRATERGRVRASAELRGLAGIAAEPAVLCHTDLGGNILFDERTGSVSVIDFGSCLITHPAVDVASLSVLGDAFVAACATTYPLLGDLIEAAAAVRNTFALQDALYGARQEDWEYVDAILADYCSG